MITLADNSKEEIESALFLVTGRIREMEGAVSRLKIQMATLERIVQDVSKEVNNG